MKKVFQIFSGARIPYTTCEWSLFFAIQERGVMHGLTIYDGELHFENSKFDLYLYLPVLGEYLMTLLDHEE